MDAKNARKLLPGTVVMRNGDNNDLGTVREVARGGFFVDWADGQRGWISYEDLRVQGITVR